MSADLSAGPGDLPGPAAVDHRGPQAVVAQHAEHALRRVGEDPEPQPPHPEAEVLRAEDHPREHAVGRVAEDQQPAGVLGRRRQQPLVIGVAAHHPVQHDHVGGLDAVPVDGDVVQPAGHPALEPGLPDQAGGLGLVRRGQLQVHRPGRARPQQLQLDLPDAAADLEDAGAGDPALLQERQHPGGGPVETAVAVAAGLAPDEAAAEELVAAERVARARHPPTVPAQRVSAAADPGGRASPDCGPRTAR